MQINISTHQLLPRSAGTPIPPSNHAAPQAGQNEGFIDPGAGENVVFLLWVTVANQHVGMK